MNAKYARFLENQRARERVIAEAERVAAGEPAKPLECPAGWEGVELEGRGDRWTGPCPACRATGHDLTRDNHLVVWESGAYGCILHPGAGGRAHRREISRRLGLRGGGGGYCLSPRVDFSAEKAAIFAAAWQAIKAELAGGLGVLGPSARIPTSPRGQFATFCGFWQPGELVWCGQVWDSRAEYLRHRFEPADPVQAEGHVGND